MKHICKISLFILAVSVFSACVSEEQQKINRRVEKLNRQIDSCKPILTNFFNVVQNFKTIAKSSETLKEINQLKSDDTLTISFLKQYFDSLKMISGDIYHMNPKIVFLQNALPIRLNPQTKGKISETQIQNIGWIDNQLVWKIYDRLKNGDPDFEISNPPDWETEETREKNTADYGNMIKEITDCRYLLGVEDIFVKPATVENSKTFESGLIFSKIHIFDIVQKKITAQYYTLNKNSSIVFVDTLNLKTKLSDLDLDLKQEVFAQLKRRFEKK
jgi:hypothetical protein